MQNFILLVLTSLFLFSIRGEELSDQQRKRLKDEWGLIQFQKNSYKKEKVENTDELEVNSSAIKKEIVKKKNTETEEGFYYKR